ncbi:CBS domain-containing protein [Acinetobacter populi]|uniref:Histidine kinase n=1 Tax=Acinetobacter populi TaxID=1582270 RepID=A0A1Z9YY41_9GAMM|nr:CBS domain-containing protein [Acinetobacter populi]MCH4247144.1 CBS domain-containing protein [Acinetobacter populi]OUY07113.1 histidine kinase [Acinetobacter populi]
MLTVAHVLQEKVEHTTYTISPDATVLEAISLMADKGIGALIVVEEENVIGILSERDYARKVALMERSSYDTCVSDIMTHKVITVDPKNTVDECLKLMTNRHLRHLPVLENGKLIGLVSIGDLVKGIIQEQQNLIEQLQNYISN